MMKSPGHQKWPDHRVEEKHLSDHMVAYVNGEKIADSTDVVLVEEDGLPARYYFPRTDVAMDKLAHTETSTTCPFKGQASYYSVEAGGQTFDDAVWTIEDPYEEHRDLKDRLAFSDDKVSEIRIQRAP